MPRTSITQEFGGVSYTFTPLPALEAYDLGFEIARVAGAEVLDEFLLLPLTTGGDLGTAGVRLMRAVLRRAAESPSAAADVRKLLLALFAHIAVDGKTLAGESAFNAHFDAPDSHLRALLVWQWAFKAQFAGFFSALGPA